MLPRFRRIAVGGRHFLSQNSPISGKLNTFEVQPKDVRSLNPLPVERLEANCKKMIGCLLRVLRTRPDVNRRICDLASSIAEAVQSDGDYTRWAKRGNKLVLTLESDILEIRYRSLSPWEVKHSFH